MATAGANKTSSVVTTSVKAGGTTISDSFKVLSISVSKEVGRISYAVIVLADGDAAKQDFESSGKDDFKPGNEIEIEAGFGTETDTIFKGIVIKHSIKIKKSSSLLIIECKDKAAKMTTVNFSKYYKDVTDSDVIEELIGKYGLTKKVDSTSASHKELVQYNCTDWDFMICRAETNGLLCINEDNELNIVKPKFSGSPIFTVAFGKNLLEFDAEVDNRLQPKGVKAASWDYSKQELVDSVEAASASVTSPGNFDADEISSDIADDSYQLVHSGPVTEQELQNWADAKLMRHRLAKVRGNATVEGNSDVKLGDIIKLEGVGDRFNGNAYVTGVRHTVQDGLWTSTFQFGIKPDWFSDTYRVNANDVNSLLPTVNGLHIGVVTKLEEDPDGEDRIQVRIPVIHKDDDGVWSRVACLDAGDKRGTFFRPEIDDEVIVGFINNDPRYSIVLGMLNSSKKAAPLTASDDNHEKGYVSRSGIKWIFNDDKKNLLIETPGGNKVFVDDDGKQIAMEDMNGNKLTMDKDGIKIESSKDLILKASGDVKGEGVNIEIKASAQFKAEGSAGAEVSSSANMVVKGAMVQIN